MEWENVVIAVNSFLGIGRGEDAYPFLWKKKKRTFFISV